MFGALGLAIDGGQILRTPNGADRRRCRRRGRHPEHPERGPTPPPRIRLAPARLPWRLTFALPRTAALPASTRGTTVSAQRPSDTVTLSYPATISGVTLSSVTVPAFTVTVKRILNNGMIRFVGRSGHTTISAKSIAGITGTASTYCIYALNKSTSGAFSATNGASVAPAAVVSPLIQTAAAPLP